MKQFRFALARVLDLRRRELEEARSRVRELRRRRDSLRAETERLQAESREVSGQIVARPVSTGRELARANEYQIVLEDRRRRSIASAQHLEAEERAAIRAAVEAHRKVRLLEILETRKLRKHSAAAEREQEALAAESFLGKFSRRAPGSAEGRLGVPPLQQKSL